MFAIQSLGDFLDNPMGRGSNAIPSRHLIRGDLTSRFNRMLKEMKKSVKVTIYRDKDEYYFHLLIPSEGVRRNNNYDVVLYFTLNGNKDLVNDKNLKRYDVKFFSNSPSFTYTYAYAFALHGMMVEFLEDKYPDIILHNLPVTRNPAEIIAYEKSITFASIYLLEHREELLTKAIINTIAKPFDESTIEKIVRNTDKIELEIKRETSRLKQLDEEEKRKEEESKRKQKRQSRQVAENKKIAPSNPKKIAPMAKKGATGSSTKKIQPRR